jgi:hypothetical protein
MKIRSEIKLKLNKIICQVQIWASQKTLWVTFTSCMSNSPCILHVLLGTGPRFKSSTEMQSSDALQCPTSLKLASMFPLKLEYIPELGPGNCHRGVKCLPTAKTAQTGLFRDFSLKKDYCLLNLVYSEQSLVWIYSSGEWTNGVFSYIYNYAILRISTLTHGRTS